MGDFKLYTPDPAALGPPPVRLLGFLLWTVVWLLGWNLLLSTGVGPVFIFLRGINFLLLTALLYALLARFTQKRHYMRLAWWVMWGAPLWAYLVLMGLSLLPSSLFRRLETYASELPWN